MHIQEFLKNIQVQQTFILSSILFVGFVFFDFDISLLEIFVTFFTVIFLDFLFLNFYKEKKTKKLIFPFSGVNAAFGICFFLRSLDIFTYIFAAILAIVGKNIFTIQGKHFLNPSNMGICVTLLLFPQYTWLNTLQWGNYTGAIGYEYIVMFIAVILAGIYICFKVYREFHYSYIYDLILPFFIIHCGLFFIIPFYESWSSFFLFFNTSFFIFTFFMLTDPKTVPKKTYTRFLYSISIVLTFYVLQFYINESYAMLLSLFVNTCFLPILWILEKKKRDIILFFIFLYIILITMIFLGIHMYGRPDLVFDNVCNQLICK